MYSNKRDGKLVWPYCIECGCRLKLDEDTRVFGKPTIYHFENDRDRYKDARGHSCLYLNHVNIINSIEEIFIGV